MCVYCYAMNASNGFQHGLTPINLRSSQSHTLARRSQSQHCHRGQQTLRHEVTQAWAYVVWPGSCAAHI